MDEELKEGFRKIDDMGKPSSVRSDTKVPNRQLLKEVVLYLEGMYKGQGDIIPLGKIHLENLWTILHSLKT